MLVQDTIGNRLLAAMSHDDFNNVTHHAVIVDLVRGDDLVLPRQPITQCWFPRSGIISLTALDEDGGEAEVGLIGGEGMGDLATVLGDRQGTSRLSVQLAGTAVRINSASFQRSMQSSPALSRLMLRYVRACSVQIASSALAFARCSIERRLARWLLMAGDRVGDDAISLTHDSLAIMLGVRRAGVSIALKSFLDGKLIETRRSNIQIRDRHGLFAAAGGSYGLAEAEYRRLIEPAARRDG